MKDKPRLPTGFLLLSGFDPEGFAVLHSVGVMDKLGRRVKDGFSLLTFLKGAYVYNAFTSRDGENPDGVRWRHRWSV